MLDEMISLTSELWSSLGTHVQLSNENKRGLGVTDVISRRDKGE